MKVTSSAHRTKSIRASHKTCYFCFRVTLKAYWGRKYGKLAVVQPTFKVRYLGFGFYWAAIYVCFQSTVLTGSSPESLEYLNIFFLTSVCVGAVMHIVFAALFLKLPRLVSAGLSPITISLILSLGICGVGLSALLGQQAYPILVAGAIIHGFSNAWIDVLWFNVYGRTNPERSSLYILVSFVVAVLLYFVVVWIASLLPVLGLVLVLLLAITAGILLQLSFRDLNSESKDSIVTLRPAKVISTGFKGLWRPLIGAVTFSLVYAFFDRLTSINVNYFTEAHAVSLFGCMIITLLLLVFTRVVRPHKADLSFVSKVALPLLILGCLLIPALGGITEVWSTVLIAIGFTVFDIMLFVLIAELAYEHSLNGAVIEGFIRGIVMIFFGIGGFIGYNIVGWDLDIIVLIVVALALINLVIIGGTAILANRQTGELDSIVLSEAQSEVPASYEEKEAMNESISERDEKTQDITDRFALTKRESEVFSYLIRGRTIIHISKELFLSEHTVRSHVRHIYEKTGVHSRQELIDLLENFNAEKVAS